VCSVVAWLAGCQSSAPPPVTSDPPSHLTKVAEGGFSSPTDAVSSPDGTAFYFAALDESMAGAVFKTSSEADSKAEKLAGGAPLVRPFGLVMSCDGETLYVADTGNDGEGGGIYAIAVDTGTVTSLGASGIASPSGLAMGPDCKTLVASGYTAEKEPAVFTLPASGGEAKVVFAGAPLSNPTGLHVDSAFVIWQMGQASTGTTTLFAIPQDGSKATPVLSNLVAGTPGGVSLVSAGGTAVIPTLDEAGKGQLTAVVIETGAITQIPAPELQKPAGLRTAREAGVFAVADGAGAIYRAE
jgi:sugar lactone lactonase YvrE